MVRGHLEWWGCWWFCLLVVVWCHCLVMTCPAAHHGGFCTTPKYLRDSLIHHVDQLQMDCSVSNHHNSQPLSYRRRVVSELDSWHAAVKNMMSLLTTRHVAGDEEQDDHGYMMRTGGGQFDSSRDFYTHCLNMIQAPTPLQHGGVYGQPLNMVLFTVLHGPHQTSRVTI